jgi:precorrin-6A/cobalt-precorrin-6A reductase
MRVLILGGTSEASALARLVAACPRIEATLSLAGRTARPAVAPIPVRIGGFGGVSGLSDYLTRQRIEAVIDATHPFAASMSRHVSEACASLDIPLLALTRVPWSTVAGDRWIDVANADEAVAALGEAPKRVFLTVGRLSLSAFTKAPQHSYLIRTIDKPEGLDKLPSCQFLLERGPFALEDEEGLMRSMNIDIVVSKNSGGDATYAKIVAARRLALPVIMIRRPKAAPTPAVCTAASALDWLVRHRHAP